jgi:4-amino-4-deoxy-L-arabinose transferase-like glycosyltransferase
MHLADVKDDASRSRASLAMWIIVAAITVLRLVIALRDLDVLDRLFIPDDSYYTLSIARSIAQGLGPAADGVHATSGFQPLIAFLMVPVFAVFDGDDRPLRLLLLLLTVADIGNALLLGRLAWRWGGRPAAVLAIVMWGLSPVAVSNSLNGMETALAVFCQLALVELWCRARETERAWDFALAGGVAGLAVLARVDSIILVLLLGVLQLIRPPRRPVLIAGGTAAVVLTPWWVYCALRFGSPIPESGAAVQEMLAAFHRFPLPERMGWAAGTLSGPPFADIKSVQNFLIDHPVPAVAAWIAVIAITVAGVWWAWSRRWEREPLLALGGFIVGVVCLYTFAVPALWFFQRYLAPPQAVVTLLLAMAGAALWRRRSNVAIAVPGAVVGTSLILVSAVITVGYTTTSPLESPDEGFHGAKGYRDAAKDMLDLMPANAVVGSFQSGALAYYACKGVTVVNLDGVVDGEAADALRDRRLAEFARQRGVTHLVDWPFNAVNFVKVSGDPDFTQEDLRPVGDTLQYQGDDRFTLHEVLWPEGPADGSIRTAGPSAPAGAGREAAAPPVPRHSDRQCEPRDEGARRPGFPAPPLRSGDRGR